MRRLGFHLAFEDDYRVYCNCSSLSRIAAKYVSPLSHGVCRPAQKGEYRRGDWGEWGDWNGDESCVGQLSEEARSSMRSETQVRSTITRVFERSEVTECHVTSYMSHTPHRSSRNTRCGSFSFLIRVQVSTTPCIVVF